MKEPDFTQLAYQVYDAINLRSSYKDWGVPAGQIYLEVMEQALRHAYAQGQEDFEKTLSEKIRKTQLPLIAGEPSKWTVIPESRDEQIIKLLKEIRDAIN